MQPDERDLISGLFERLQPFNSQPRDPEAERLIAALVQRQPAAPYLLAQTALVQEQALKAAQQRIAELEGKAAPAASGGFLGSAPRIGPWGPQGGARAQDAPAPMTPQAASPTPQWGGGTGGGSFLRTALTTAAGVAGGALLFQGISNLIGGNPGPFAAHASPLLPPDSMPSDRLPPSDQFSAADPAQDAGAADDYDVASNDLGFDDDSGSADI